MSLYQGHILQASIVLKVSGTDKLDLSTTLGFLCVFGKQIIRACLIYLFIYLLTYFVRVPVQFYTALPQGPIITNKIHHC